MKMDCMIIGIEAINDYIMEIKLVEVANAHEKTNIQDIAMTGDIKQITNAIDRNTQRKHILYLPREYCSSNALLPFQSMTIELKPAIGAEKERIHKKVFKE